MLDESKLELGDIIYFMNSLGQVDHVAIYIGHRKHVPFVIHAVSKPYDSIMMTRLQEPDRACSYEVYRLKQSRLSWLAVAILFRWVEIQVPYATAEKQETLERELSTVKYYDHPTLGGKIQESFAKETFKSTFHQYVDKACHLDGSYGAASELESMACSESIVYAFNMAEMIHNDALTYVRHESSSGTFVWNTAAYPSENAYVEWVRAVMPFDARRVRAQALFEHSKEAFEWRSMGKLLIHPAASLPEEKFNKADWLLYTAQLFKDAPLKRREYLTVKPECDTPDSEDLVRERASQERRARDTYTAMFSPVSPKLYDELGRSPAGDLFRPLSPPGAATSRYPSLFAPLGRHPLPEEATTTVVIPPR